jgi:Protein of unknown function (DUF1580)
MSVTPAAGSRLLQEQLISLSQAGRRFPKSRHGKATHLTPSAIWRWVTDGVRAADGRRVKLEAVFVAGRWLTSIEAIERFVTAQQPTGGQLCPITSGPSRSPSPADRRRAAEKAGNELEKLGM